MLVRGLPPEASLWAEMEATKTRVEQQQKVDRIRERTAYYAGRATERGES